MRFGDALKAIGNGAVLWAVDKATPKTRGQTIEIVTAEPFGLPPVASAKSLAEMYNKNPWVRSIVAKVSRAVARQPWYLEKPNGDRVDEHPLINFLNAGSPKLKGKAARQISSALVDLTGECFWIIGRNAQGVPVQFAPIPPHWAIDTPTERFNGFRIQPRSGVTLELEASDVLWIKDPNPVDPYGRGSSYTGAASVEIATDEAASDMLRAVFKNRARPDIVVSGTADAPIGAKERPAFEANWLEKFRGPNRAGRPFFSSQKLEITEIGNSLKDNAMAELREQGQSFIREFYGAPPELFGVLESSNRATIDSADYLFAKHMVDPRLQVFLDAIEDFADEEFGLGNLKLRYESPISEDLEFALKVVSARPAAFSDNEVRALAKHKPVEGRDELPEPAEVDPVMQADSEDDAKDKKPNKGKKPKKADDEEKAAAESEAVDVRRKAFSADDVVSFSGLHEAPQVRAEATKVVDELLGLLITQFGGDLLEDLADGARFEVTGAIAEFIAQETPELLGRIDETTRRDLRASLVEGVALNEGVEALIARVNDVFKNAADIRASTIGDTVATKLAGFATQTAGQQAGFEKKKWLSTRDQLVRSTHAGLDGQTVLMGGEFVSPAGNRAKHPGAFGVASEDVNCRCAMRPIVDGEDESKSSDMTNEEFVALWSKLWTRTSKKAAARFRDIFDAQRAVIVHEMQRLGSFRL